MGMESGGSRRSGWLTAGGVLSIVGGAFEVVGAGMLVAIAVSVFIWSREHPGSGVPSVPGVWPEDGVILVWPTWFVIAVVGVALGVVAIVGGVSALRRKSFRLSLAGAICALPSSFFGTVPISVVFPVSVVSLASRIYGWASVILAILAITFISLSKREFATRGEESGIQGQS
jgi:hypothetical protein